MDDLDAIERFSGLYDEYRNRVYAYAVSRAGRQLADEVVSEVFLVRPQPIEAHAGAALATPRELENAILTAYRNLSRQTVQVEWCQPRLVLPAPAAGRP